MKGLLKQQPNLDDVEVVEWMQSKVEVVNRN